MPLWVHLIMFLWETIQQRVGEVDVSQTRPPWHAQQDVKGKGRAPDFA